MSAGRHDDDKTDPEGMETILVEHENGHANGNGTSYDLHTQAELIKGIGAKVAADERVQEQQARELTGLHGDVVKLRGELKEWVEHVKALAGKITIANAIQRSIVPSIVGGIVSGGIVVAVAWFALHH